MNDNKWLAVATIVAFVAVVVLGIWSLVDSRIKRWVTNAALGVAFLLFALTLTGWIRWFAGFAGAANLVSAMVTFVRARRKANAASATV